MDQPSFEQARQYALGRLERELPPYLFYHSLAHTRDEVAPAVERLAALEDVTGEDLLLVRTAAYFHDLGFIEQYAGHEAIGVQLAREALPRFGYNPAHLAAIGGMIMATKLPQTPRTRLEELMADADLDLLGREAFLARNRDLRAELAALGQSFTEQVWYGEQAKFLQHHRYFTASARALRDAAKQENIERLLALLTDGQVRG